MDGNNNLIDGGCTPVRHQLRKSSVTCENYHGVGTRPSGMPAKIPLITGSSTLSHASSETVLYNPRLPLHVTEGLLAKPMNEFRAAISWLDSRSLAKPGEPAALHDDAPTLLTAPSDLPSPSNHCMMPLEMQPESGCPHLLCRRYSPVGLPSFPTPGVELDTAQDEAKGSDTDGRVLSRAHRSTGMSSWASADNILGKNYEPSGYRNWWVHQTTPNNHVYRQPPSSRHLAVDAHPGVCHKVERVPSPSLQKRQMEAKKKSLLREDALRRLQDDCTKAYILIRSYNSNDSLSSVDSLSESQSSSQGSTDSLPSISQDNTQSGEFPNSADRVDRDEKRRSWSPGDMVETYV